MTHLVRLLILSLAAALSPLAAHALMAGSASGSPADSPAARIDSPASSTAWSGAVAINIGGAYSGVLVASRYVLTAAHVAAGSVANPAGVQVVFNLADGQTSIPASRIDVFPSFSFPYDDIALIQLSQDAPAGAQRYAVLDTAISAGTTFTMVGYGDSGYGNVGANVSRNVSTRRYGENRADLLQAAVDGSGRTSAFYIYDFDGSTGNGAFGGKTLGNTRETMVAVGDSGSPAFVTQNGKRYLMGINSFAADVSNIGSITYTFGNGGGGIRLSDPRFVSWLREKSTFDIRMASDPELAEGDAPLPLWALGLLGMGLLAAMYKRRNT